MITLCDFLFFIQNEWVKILASDSTSFIISVGVKQFIKKLIKALELASIRVIFFIYTIFSELFLSGN